MAAKETIELARENDAKIVEVRFLDLAGSWRSFAMPVKQLDEGFFTTGRFFEGAGIRGCQNPEPSGVTIIPDPKTARFDPFSRVKTLCFMGLAVDPQTGSPLTRDPRTIAGRAKELCSRGGTLEGLEVSAEIDFYVFDEVRYDQTRSSGYFFVDSDEGRISAARDEGSQKQVQKDQCYAPSGHEAVNDLSHEVIEEFLPLGQGTRIELREGQGPGQFTAALSPADLLTLADNILWLKYVVKNVARKYGRVATFMPRPLSEENPNGMNLLWSMKRDGEDVFAGGGYGGHSREALSFTGGLLKHSPALSALVNSTTNSFKRLAPGPDSPVNLAYSLTGRAVAAGLGGISMDGTKAVRYRLPDPAMNPCLGLAAVALAGMDGIKDGADPGPPLEGDPNTMTDEELRNVPVSPVSLEEALAALEDDQEFLVKDGVFCREVLSQWVGIKMDAEVSPGRARPTPLEFALYFDS